MCPPPAPKPASWVQTCCRATAPCSAQSSLPEPTPRACSSSALPRAEVRSPEPLFQIHSNPSPPPSFFSVNLKAHSHLLQSLSHPIHPRPSLLVPRVSHSPLSPTPSCLASHPQHPFTFTPSLFTTSFVLCQTPHSLPEEHNSRWAPNSPTYADISAHFAAAAAPRPSSDLCQLSQPPKLTFSLDLAHGRFESPNAAYTCLKSAKVNSEAIKNKMHPRRIG